MRKSFLLLFVLIFTLGLGGAYQKLILGYAREHTYPDSVIVIIPKTMSAKAIGELLQARGVISSSDIFYWSVRLRKLGPKLRSGEYEFPKSRSLQSIVEKLVSGDILFHRLTIPEGLTSTEILTLIKNEEKLTGDLPSLEEGSVLPETYTYARGTSRSKLVKDMQADLQKALDRLWDGRQEGLPFKTKSDALILASIVEKETALEVERPRIAAVFINRLHKGMALQTDPTVIYALEKQAGKPFDRPLYKKDLSVDSPYNTYIHKGLPPTPICHAGLASLKAVLNPIQSEELYFVADGSGGHVFSKTYQEHSKNHQNWRQIQKKK